MTQGIYGKSTFHRFGFEWAASRWGDHYNPVRMMEFFRSLTLEWCVVLALLIGGLWHTLSRHEWALTAYVLGPKNKRDLAAWRVRLADLLDRNTHLSVARAELSTEIAEFVLEAPPHLANELLEGVDLARAAERAMRRRAAELGVGDLTVLFPQESEDRASVTPIRADLVWNGVRMVKR